LSHGCIRMGNEAITELFEWVKVGDRVLIEDSVFLHAEPQAAG
jgi:lipoprotein-anchoring transpeptidase ErfK/SrfK